MAQTEAQKQARERNLRRGRSPSKAELERDGGGEPPAAAAAPPADPPAPARPKTYRAKEPANKAPKNAPKKASKKAAKSPRSSPDPAGASPTPAPAKPAGGGFFSGLLDGLRG